MFWKKGASTVGLEDFAIVKKIKSLNYDCVVTNSPSNENITYLLKLQHT